MNAYCIVDIKAVHDPAATERYRADVTATVETLAADTCRSADRGGDRGRPATTFPLLIDFPSMHHADEWYRSPEYAELLAIRSAATGTDAMFVEALPAAER